MEDVKIVCMFPEGSLFTKDTFQWAPLKLGNQLLIGKKTSLEQHAA